MNVLSASNTASHDRVPARTARQALLALAFATLACALVACSSGSAGNGVAIGSGASANDPVSPDFPVAYIKRQLPDPADPDAMELEDDLRVQRVWNGPADVWLRERASPSALERNVTERITRGEWDVRDLDASPDGKKLVFSMRQRPRENADESEQPRWAIYEYEIATDTLKRVIASDIVANDGHDVGPHYLPDGRILFSSTRQRGSKAVLIDEGKAQFAAGIEGNRNLPAFLLHVMNADGTGIRQISYHMSHDLDPTVLSSGLVLFSRWDRGAGAGMHLYTVRPDGGDLQLLYGRNSHATGTNNTPVQFVQARERPDGQVVALMRQFEGTEFGGDLVLIDVRNYVENTQPAQANAGGRGPAQTRLVVNDVRTIPGPSPGGRYSSVYPLWDGTNRLLVSWSLCRLVEAGRIVPCTSTSLAQPAVVPAPPLYGVWIYDPRSNTQLPVVAPEEGVMFTEIVALQPRSAPPAVVRDAVAGVDYPQTLETEGVGILNIRSVYDLAGVDSAPGGIAAVRDPARTTGSGTAGLVQRPAMFLRIEKAVSLPDEEVLEELPNYAFGVSNVGMRELIGYAPVEPDGSVRVKVPANVALQISVLDVNARRISGRHTAWLQVRTGETLNCSGCHVRQAGAGGAPPLSHGRQGLFASANPGAPTTGSPFPNTDPAIFADMGETMAEARGRISCSVDRCASLLPSVNVLYEDVWTAPGLRPADAPFAWRYTALETPLPTSPECDLAWEARCRVVIHYPTHVAPLWTLDRQVIDPNDGVTVLEDRTCVACHSPTDAANQVRVPAGQLDLRNTPSLAEQNQYTSFRELLFTRNAREVNMGALQDLPGPVIVQPSMSGAGANASTRFFTRFAPGGSHAGWLSPAELRLIAEWLDLGGQYYNDPFAIPVN